MSSIVRTWAFSRLAKRLMGCFDPIFEKAVRQPLTGSTILSERICSRTVATFAIEPHIHKQQPSSKRQSLEGLGRDFGSCTSWRDNQNILFFASSERIRLCFDAVVGRSSSLKGGQPRTLMRIVGEYVNMISKGIIDPTKVVRVALQGAASVAGLLITTEAMVAELPNKNAAASRMPSSGGMGFYNWAELDMRSSRISFLAFVLDRRREPNSAAFRRAND